MIVKTPDVCFGKSRIDGTRIYTSLIIRLSDRGWTIAMIQDDYPHLSEADIMAAIKYERRFWRRLRRWIGGYLPEFEGTVTWRGREWDWE